MKVSIAKITAMFMSFCIIFTGVPLLAGDLDVHALAKTANKIRLNASASGENSVTLKWNKIKKPNKGYAVFRDGDPIAHLGKSKVKYSDTGLKAGTSYTYQIRVYKYKKVKKWLNKATGKWQKKKPAKKNRGRSKKFKVPVYGKASNTVTIKTAGKSKRGKKNGTGSGGTGDESFYDSFEDATKSLSDCTYNIAYLPSSYEYGYGTVVYDVFCRGTITWTSSNPEVATVTSKFNGGECCLTIKGVGKTTITVADSIGNKKNFVVTVVDTSTSGGITGDGGSNNVEVRFEEDAERELSRLGISYMTFTTKDYLGTSHTYYKYGSYYYSTLLLMYEDVVTHESTYGRISNERLVFIDRNRNGTFKDGDTTYIQQGGVTFNKTLLDNPDYNDSTFGVDPYVEMYNGDFDKLTFDIKTPIETIGTHDKDMNEITIPFVMKDGKRLAMYGDISTQTGAITGSPAWYAGSPARKVVQVKRVSFATYDYGIQGLGFVSGDIEINVYYDGTLLTEWSIPVNANANEEGLSPLRQTCLSLAEEALAAKGKTGDYDTDMRSIDRYVEETYPYGYCYDPYGYGSKGKIYLTCVGGALTLETYSIYAHGVYGFDSWGQYRTQENAEACGAGEHEAFSLDSDPRIYWQTNGYQTW